MSKKQLEANRQNAKLGGVKTPEGKAISSQNALKHGLYSKSLIINTGLIKESEEEFNKLLEGIYKSLNPENALQEELVQTIAICVWRHRRAIVAESGEIRQSNDNLEFDYAKAKRIEKNNREIAWTLGWRNITTEEKYEVVEEVKKRLDAINSIIIELEATQDLNSTDMTALDRLFDPEDSPFLMRVHFNKEYSSSTLPERTKNILATLKEEQRVLQKRFDQLSEIDTNKQIAQSMSNFVPANTDRIVRYVSSIDKQMKNALEMFMMLKNSNAPTQK